MVDLTIILTRNIPFFITLSNDSNAQVRDLIRKKDNISKIKEYIIEKLNPTISPKDFEIGAFYMNGGPLKDETMQLDKFLKKGGYFQIIPIKTEDSNFEIQDLLYDAREMLLKIQLDEMSKNKELKLANDLKNAALKKAKELKEELEKVKEECRRIHHCKYESENSIISDQEGREKEKSEMKPETEIENLKIRDY